MKCLVCGCTDERACPGGCSWYAAGFPVCSVCVDKAQQQLGLGQRVSILDGALKGTLGTVVELPDNLTRRIVELPTRQVFSINHLKPEKSR